MTDFMPLCTCTCGRTLPSGVAVPTDNSKHQKLDSQPELPNGTNVTTRGEHPSSTPGCTRPESTIEMANYTLASTASTVSAATRTMVGEPTRTILPPVLTKATASSVTLADLEVRQLVVPTADVDDEAETSGTIVIITTSTSSTTTTATTTAAITPQIYPLIHGPWWEPPKSGLSTSTTTHHAARPTGWYSTEWYATGYPVSGTGSLPLPPPAVPTDTPRYGNTTTSATATTTARGLPSATAGITATLPPLAPRPPLVSSAVASRDEPWPAPLWRGAAAVKRSWQQRGELYPRITAMEVPLCALVTVAGVAVGLL
ncbi:hypothetical protein Micbo1qcDRAFT_170441 [Microdochium bolleyi]|uniref:Uncharacterized protein n=1 Tax=Microdochium bolleyi TaxID=196109 RepID=A0A136JHN6_9PEZI|nr:hypothetical protein Micbo1qcDRAFT_170441 [Microdochium bolleyi]